METDVGLYCSRKCRHVCQITESRRKQRDAADVEDLVEDEVASEAPTFVADMSTVESSEVASVQVFCKKTVSAIHLYSCTESILCLLCRKPGKTKMII